MNPNSAAHPSAVLSYSHQDGLSTTESLHFCCYVAASGRLKFLRCDKAPRGGVQFVFDDPCREISQIYHDYVTGGQAPALKLFQSYRKFRQAIDSAQEQEGVHQRS